MKWERKNNYKSDIFVLILCIEMHSSPAFPHHAHTKEIKATFLYMTFLELQTYHHNSNLVAHLSIL